MEDADITGADITVEGTTAGAGGEIVVIPALVGIGATLSGMYSVGKAVDNYRFWNDYYKRTGFKPKYPWRSGYYDSGSWLAGANYSFSKLKRL